MGPKPDPGQHPGVVYFQLITLLGEYFGYDYHYCLYRLTLTQALTLVEVKNERERKANAASGGDDGYEDTPNGPDPDWNPTEFDAEDIDSLPSVEDLQSLFGGSDLF